MIYFLISALIIAGDQFFKHWIVGALSEGTSMKLLPGIIKLTYVRNDGISFGALKGMTIPVIIFTVIICAFIIWALAAKRFKNVGEKLGAGLVLGGAIGNLIDRVVNGYVVDMFQPEFVNFAIFNIADIAITGGCLIFCIAFLVGDIRARRELMAYKSRKRDEAAEKTLMEALSAFKPQNAEAAEAAEETTEQEQAVEATDGQPDESDLEAETECAAEEAPGENEA